METMTCTHCMKEKPIDGFYLYPPGVRYRYKPGSRRPKCKQCLHEQRGGHRRANPEMAAATARRAKIKRLFGMTTEDFDRMLAEQNGVCAICGKGSPDHRRLQIDHCHDTGRVRGILCYRCNGGMGMFRDQVPLLQRAIQYILNGGTTTPLPDCCS